jgi:hypothetical protein
MRCDLFERDYQHLADSEDAQTARGSNIHRGVATVGDIRKACAGHPPDASIRLENNGSGFYVDDPEHEVFSG